MRRMLGQPEVLGCLRRARRDDVPASATAADVIERGKQPCEVVRLCVGCRGGRDQSDACGGGRDRGEERDRLEPEALGGADIVRQRRAVGEEYRVELVGFGALRQLLIVGDIENSVRRRSLVTPGRLVMAIRIDEEVQRKLPCAHGWLANVSRCWETASCLCLSLDSMSAVAKLSMK